ncbi:MAG: PqqD family protein [Chloroflexi bacterium]|nr:MAG: PqqD family protein [Chloroflexota bacterium]
MNVLPLRRNPSVLEQDLGDELLLYSAGGQDVHVLNATGRAVWRLCDGQRSPQEIAAQLQTQFSQTDERNVMADVQRMIADLTERQLLAG